MIKSRLNKFALVLVFIGTLVFVTLDFLLFLQKYSDIEIFKLAEADFNEGLFIMTCMSAFCLFISLNILIKLKSITIDKRLKTITLKNYLTRHKRIYLIRELDGYTESYFGKGFRSIIFIKDKTKIEKVSNISIQNFDEILNGLSNLKHIGIDSSSIIERIKDTFRFK